MIQNTTILHPAVSKVVLIAMLLTLLPPCLSCSVESRQQLAPVESADLQAAVIEYLISNTTLPNDVLVGCVSIDGKDPDLELLKRFAKRNLTLVVGSTCSLIYNADSPGPPALIVEASTGRRGVKFVIREFHWLGPNHVEVIAGYELGVLAASTEILELRLENGKWLLKKIKKRKVA